MDVGAGIMDISPYWNKVAKEWQVRALMTTDEAHYLSYMLSSPWARKLLDAAKEAENDNG